MSMSAVCLPYSIVCLSCDGTEGVEMRSPTYERADGERFVLVIEAVPLCLDCTIALASRFGKYVDERPSMVKCKGCEKLPHEVNHPQGMVFVGWGRGWEPCPRCGGSGWVEKND